VSAEPRYFRIGVFIILSLLILAGAIVVFGAGQLFKQRVLFETYIDGSVQGIDVGSQLKFRGVPIGKVEAISFIFSEYRSDAQTPDYNYVYIEMEVTKEIFPGMFESDLKQLIRKHVQRGLRVRIEPAGITGINFLNMDYLDPEQYPPLKIYWTPEHYYIPSAPSELNTILDSLNNIMREVENLNLKGISDNLVTLLDTVDQSVKAADVAALSANAQAALAEVTRATQRLTEILGNVEPLTEINPDEIQETLSNLQALSENLRALSSELRSSPSRLIFSPPPPATDVYEPKQRRR